MNLNGGYAMIKYNSTQEELQIAYRSKKPALLYDENQRAHWAVIEETATESIDEETQELITLYKYSYRLLDEESTVIANPTLSGDEATLDGLEVDGTKYKVGGSGGSEVHLYEHRVNIAGVDLVIYDSDNKLYNNKTNIVNYLKSVGAISTSTTDHRHFRRAVGFDKVGDNYNLVVGLTVYNNDVYIVEIPTFNTYQLTSYKVYMGSGYINETVTQIF